jgi:hypothetical protein
MSEEPIFQTDAERAAWLKSAWLTLHRVTVRPFGNRWEAFRKDPPTIYIGATEDEAIAGIAGMMRVGVY